jgi:membrane protein implicated in regulation of membrane protease activity
MLLRMSEADFTDLTAEWARSDRQAYFEQRIFVRSPLGDGPTALLIFVVLMSSCLLIAWMEGAVMFARTAGEITVASPMQTAFALSVTLSAALYVQRYTRVRERKDYENFARTLKPGAIEKHNVVSLTPGHARLVPATWLGLFGGIAASLVLYMHYQLDTPMPGIFAWFMIVTTLLIISFTRGVELSRTGTQGAHTVIAEELRVDLLRIDHLSVWGRSAARFALIWFTVGAVSCLFFLESGLNIFTIGLVAVFLVLGVWVFLRTMQPVHKKIRAAKTIELERVRGEIETTRKTAASDVGAATRMQGLLAYEARIEAVPEWPFDQTTIFRVGASALILTVPWFGQAVAQFAIEHLAH